MSVAVLLTAALCACVLAALALAVRSTQRDHPRSVYDTDWLAAAECFYGRDDLYLTDAGRARVVQYCVVIEGAP